VPGGLDDLPELVETATAAGLHVEAHLPAITGIPVLVAHTVHRIVREALTNALKHAPASHVRLEVHRSGEEATVTVTNTLTQPDGPAQHAPGSGTGLVSMGERATLLGGRLTAGREGRSWRVCATLPLHPADAAPATRGRA
jgi:signal transduction histidine kinase